MKAIDRPLLVLLASGAVVASACGGGGGAGGASSQFAIAEVSNGFGRMLPYQIAVRDAEGNPTPRVIEITTIDDLVNNVTAANPVLAPTEWPLNSVLPSNVAGNHFFYARFTQPIDADSVLSPAVTASVNSFLIGSIKVVEVDPNQGTTIDIEGRAFVGGRAYGIEQDSLNPSNFLLQPWVVLDTDPNSASFGDLIPTTVAGFQPGLGFPGTQGGFAGDDLLVSENTFVFVVDTDDDLTTFETFPANRQIQMRINEDVDSVGGRSITEVGVASSTVGPDTIPPEVLGASGNFPVIIPGQDDEDVDPETNIEIQFTEPIQILSVGQLDDGSPPGLSSAVQLTFGPSVGRVDVPFFVRPFSVYDLSRLELIPSYNFPGSAPPDSALPACGTFGRVTVNVSPTKIQDQNANANAIPVDVDFTTREGAGVVNAPVVPSAIYIGRGGSEAGISVIDMFGFGQGTGTPAYDSVNPFVEGNTNFPNNPNTAVIGPSLIPPLIPGNCTFNGGSEGPFTLTKGSSLDDLLARSPIIESVGDMAVGHSLDNTFNNAGPFGCQAGGGNLCASTGLKRVLLQAGGANGLAPSTNANLPVKVLGGFENLVSWAPSPNPPPIVFPPLCQSPLIASQEPTSAQSGATFTNLLVPGANGRGNATQGKPPTNLLVLTQNSFFNGPSAITTPQNCLAYSSRQQIGHFLYVLDRVAAEIVILNSNTFTVIDRIRLPDPTSFAMSPNVDLLAVTNEGADQVSFIDIDPASSSFHRIVRTVAVGAGPTGIAWESGNEDIFVCNQTEGTVSILSAFSLRVRKVVRNQISRPIDVALTPRQLGFFGFQRGVYFGYVLNQDGTVAFFESGPSGPNGWGFDETIGTLPFRFFQPKAIQPDILSLNSAVWIAHEKPLDANGDATGRLGGAITNVGIASGNVGINVLSNASLIPQLRNLGFGVFASVGEGPGGLSGVPTDMAFDNMLNVSALTNFSTTYSAGQALSYNGKSLVRLGSGGFNPSSVPQFMFLAVPNPGVIDVLKLSTGTAQRVDTNVFQAGIQSIPAPNASVIVDYFRQ